MEERDNATLELMDIGKIIKKKIWLVILISVVAAAASGVYSVYFIKPKYQSKISVVISRIPSKTQQNIMDYNDIMMFQNLVKTYSQIATSRTVAQKAIDELGINQSSSVDKLLSQINVTPQTDTQIINLTVTDENPEMAKDKVNSVTKAFMSESQRIFPDGSVQTIDEAIAPNHPVSPNKKQNIIIAFFIGMFFSLGLIFLLEQMDNTIKSELELEQNLGIPVMGLIPKVRN